MMRSLRGIKLLTGVALAAWLCAGSSGCQALNDGGFFARHMANDHRHRAQERWDGMRGNVELQVAEQHFRAGRLEDASKALKRVLAMTPQSVGAYKLACRLHIEQGELSRARDAVSTALLHSANDAETQYLAGIVAERYGEMGSALEHYVVAQSLAPNEVEYVLAVAETWMALDKPDKALEVVEARLTDFDGCTAIWMLAARLSRAVGLKKSAVEYCREAHRLDKGDAWTDVEIGLTLIWAERFAEAVEILRPLIDASAASSALGNAQAKGPGPVAPSVACALARAYVALEDWREAREVLKPVMSMDATDATAWCLYARASLMAGDVKAAGDAISTLNNRVKPTAETLLLQAYVSYWLGDFAAADLRAREALDRDSQLDSARWLIARSRLALQGNEHESDDGVAAPASNLVPQGAHEMNRVGSYGEASSQALLDALAAETTLGEFRPAELPTRPSLADSTTAAGDMGGDQP